MEHEPLWQWPKSTRSARGPSRVLRSYVHVDTVWDVIDRPISLSLHTFHRIHFGFIALSQIRCCSTWWWECSPTLAISLKAANQFPISQQFFWVAHFLHSLNMMSVLWPEHPEFQSTQSYHQYPVPTVLSFQQSFIFFHRSTILAPGISLTDTWTTMGKTLKKKKPTLPPQLQSPQPPPPGSVTSLAIEPKTPAKWLSNHPFKLLLRGVRELGLKDGLAEGAREKETLLSSKRVWRGYELNLLWCRSEVQQ